MPEDNKSKRITITLIILTLLIFGSILIYFVSMNAQKLWPERSNQSGSSQQAKTPKIVFEKPIIDEKSNMLHLNTQIETTEQGECTLTLSSSENNYVLKNSTIGVEGRTGCLD